MKDSLSKSHMLSIMTSAKGKKIHLRTGCVKTTKVNANPDLPALLEHRDNISNPVWTLLFSNEATFDELMNFGFDCFHDIRSKSSLLLLNRFGIQFDVKMMHGHLRIKTRHVFIALGKDIYILSYERYEVLLLRW